jgi:hypothetical protein
MALSLRNSRLFVLDFLGFPRQNRNLSMSYAAFSQEKKSRALFRRSGAGTGRQGPWTFRRRRIAHPASIALFLIFCNHLLSDPSRFGRPDPKAARSTA